MNVDRKDSQRSQKAVVRKLRAFARRWGADIVEVSEKDFEALKRLKNLRQRYKENAPDEFYEAPFTGHDIGVHWPSRTVVYAGEVFWPDFVHELAHAIATLQGPDSVEETTFLGWEVQLAKRVGDLKTWLKANKDYGLDEDREDGTRWYSIGDIPKKDLPTFLAERIEISRKAGILDAKLQPISPTRTLDVEALQAKLLKNLDEYVEGAKVAQKRHVSNGSEFERRVEEMGYAAGYETAVYDTLRMLHEATQVKFSVKDLIAKVQPEAEAAE